MTADTLILIGRVLTGGAFLILGLRNIANHGALTGLMRFRKLPLPPVAAAIGIGMQIVFGALLTLGLFQTVPALALALFIVMATAIAHSPFMGTPDERKANLQACLSSAIMLGGLAALAGAGLSAP